MTGAWWTRAKPGDKVVCVDDREDAYTVPSVVWYRDSLDGLTAGTVYTVRAIARSPNPYHDWFIVQLVEITRPHDEWGEGGYHVNRFRPVERDRTERGMAILNKLLASVKSTTDA